MAQLVPGSPRFLLAAGEELLPVASDDVAYFYTRHEVVYLVRHDGRKFTVAHHLEQLEKMLDPARFFRLNRQYLASAKAIDKIYSYFVGKLKIELLPLRTDEILVSRDRAAQLKRWLKSPLPVR